MDESARGFRVGRVGRRKRGRVVELKVIEGHLWRTDREESWGGRKEDGYECGIGGKYKTGKVYEIRKSQNSKERGNFKCGIDDHTPQSEGSASNHIPV